MSTERRKMRAALEAVMPDEQTKDAELRKIAEELCNYGAREIDQWDALDIVEFASRIRAIASAGTAGEGEDG